MNKIKNTFYCVTILLSVMWFQASYAQQSANSSGGVTSGSTGTVSFSVGQVFYNTNTGATGKVEQGVQHAYEVMITKTSIAVESINLYVFPNPTLDYLTLQTGNYKRENISYRLYDTQGKLLESKTILDAQTLINMKEFPVATYFLKIIQANQEIKTFKIIKI